MKKFIGLVLWAFLLPTIAFAQVGANSICYTTNGNNCVPSVSSYSSVKIDNATAVTAELVALDTAKTIWVTSFNVVSAGTGTIKFVYGTGTACGTGTTDLTGAYNLTANGYVAVGSGLGAVLSVPKGNALCITTTGAVQRSGSVSYAQF